MGEEDEHSHCEFYYPEDLETFDVETETGITECHIINNLLTELAWAVLGNIGLPGSVMFFVYCVCIIMLHLRLNDMEIPESKRFDSQRV